jgi:8-oxo-dGTP pyrophosphatase MutT (NUDIX family)
MTKILSSKPIFHADLFTVFEDSIELQNKEKRTYHHVKRNSAISVIPITANNEVYLINQYRYLYEKWMVEAIAGMVDPGEDPLTTAKRELKEESGLEAKAWKQIGLMHGAGSIVTWDHYLFVAKEITEGDSQLEASEQIELIKVPISVAVEKVLNGEITTSASMTSILLVNQLLIEGKI